MTSLVIMSCSTPFASYNMYIPYTFIVSGKLETWKVFLNICRIMMKIVFSTR
ncbi:hypothetical protein DJ95_587 [Bacillus atrophaeus subsp. globigii]|nr:hypothetical protein DJ95_587 [Bacillus atrophaeus subsp. globigii]ARW06197.1 hypothetical protein S101359_01189 [Bacillus atrophaeus]KFK83614.1 hypothetical protein DK44_3049 [Bacillus atrophaeus]MDQ0926989.1 hypothetical protein [Bacillus atrophaeus]